MAYLKYLLIPATCLALIAAQDASAKPRAISTDSGHSEPILGVPNGEIMAMFISSAPGADADYIALGGPGLTNDLPTPGTPIFCTQTISGLCGAATAPGAIADLGKATPTGDLPANIFPTGNIQLVLVDTTTNTTFASNIAVESPDSSFGSGFVFQNWVTSNYDDFGFGALPAFAAATLSALPAAAHLQFIGWDNTVSCPDPDPLVTCNGQPGSGVDPYQYNDVVMAVWAVGGNAVPEPLTLALFGAGLLGAAVCTRRRASQNI